MGCGTIVGCLTFILSITLRDGISAEISTSTSGYITTRQDDICGNYNGRRLYLELGERGILTAKNVSWSAGAAGRTYNGLIGSSGPTYSNASSHEQCRLELITCPACVVSITFRQLGLPHSCGGANLLIDSPCRCDYVWLSEPPYDDASGAPFCGVYSSLPTDGPNAVTYKSLTRTLNLVLLYSEAHNHAFTLEYVAERNKKILTGSPGGGAILPSSGNVSHGGILKSPFFPAPYPRDLGVEYVIACQPELSVSCRVRVLFRDFQLAPTSIMEFYDWNGQRLDVSSGALFRPPIILSTGPSLLIRFYANGGTSLGYKAIYSFFTGNVPEKAIKPITDCGGVVENFGGAITMMNMVNSGVKTYDCVWIIRPPKNYLHLKTHLYLKVATFLDMAGNTELEILRGVTSEQPVLETLRHPITQLQPPRHREHVVPVDVGFYVSLRGTFGPTSRLAIVYTAFSYMDCFSGSDTLCQNHRCIPSQLYCDGFDHCGDNSDEPTSCYQEWKTEPHPDRHWYSHTPNYYFPKMERYPDLKTATLVFVVSSLGLILLIAALIILLYRMGARARQQRELQNHLQTISELLDGARIDEIIPDDPPDYEAPPDYDEVIKVFPEMPQSQRRKRKRDTHHRDTSRHSRSTSSDPPYNSSTRTEQRVNRDHLEVREVAHHRYLAGSAPGLLLLPNDGQFQLVTPAITSRSCQTTPVPDSPPPSYVASITTEQSRYGQLPTGNLLLTSYNIPQLPPPISPDTSVSNENSVRNSKRGKRARQSWLLFQEDEGPSQSNVQSIVTPQGGETGADDHSNQLTQNQSPTSLDLVRQYSTSSSSSDDSDDNTFQTVDENSFSAPRQNLLQVSQASGQTLATDLDTPDNGSGMFNYQHIGHVRTQSGDNSAHSFFENLSSNESTAKQNYESCQSLSIVNAHWVPQNFQNEEQVSHPQNITGQQVFLANISANGTDTNIVLSNQYNQKYKLVMKNEAGQLVRQTNSAGEMNAIADHHERISLPEVAVCPCDGACECLENETPPQKLVQRMRSMSVEFPLINTPVLLESEDVGPKEQTDIAGNTNSPQCATETNGDNFQARTQNRLCNSPEAQDFFSNTLIIGGKPDVF